jgi:hypothetical protein
MVHFDDFSRCEEPRGDREAECQDRPLIGISDQKTMRVL